MFIVVDIRDNDVKWTGTLRECKKWIVGANPLNQRHYVIYECVNQLKKESIYD